MLHVSCCTFVLLLFLSLGCRFLFVGPCVRETNDTVRSTAWSSSRCASSLALRKSFLADFGREEGAAIRHLVVNLRVGSNSKSGALP